MADGGRIELRAVCKSYGTQTVLDRADAVVERGEFVAIVGRSGSGKSTLLKLIGALSQPDSGSIRHGDHDLARMSETERTLFRRRELGFVFQFFNLVPTLTVRENVMLPLALNRVPRSAAGDRANALLRTLGLDACADRLPDQLSGGEQQRVAIARALAHTPSLVVTDEPTGNLDTDTAEEVLELLVSSCREHGATLIMATHNREAAARADRVLRIAAGRIEAEP
jgi:putative ABC transport system ATP-binding protein